MLITFTLLAAVEAVVKQVQDAVRTDAAHHGRRSTLSHREVRDSELPDYAERPRLGGTVKPRPFR
jgi:hypothetical protein